MRVIVSIYEIFILQYERYEKPMINNDTMIMGGDLIS